MPPMSDLPTPLVNVQWLHEHLSEPGLIVLDASVPPVVPGFVALNAEGPLKVIPGARRMDYDKEICLPDSSLPHMMPGQELFEEKIRELGINNDSRLVVYDDTGVYASPRGWWMLRAMGHEQVTVLDGGLPAWIEAGLPINNTYETAVAPGHFKAQPAEHGFCDFETVLQALDNPDYQIVDARSNGRFHGIDPEPRPNLRGGHMPSARNLPCKAVVNEWYMKSPEELRMLFSDLVNPEQTLVTSCGSGLTACMLTLAATLAGHKRCQVYDGSWAEWGMPSKLPVTTE